MASSIALHTTKHKATEVNGIMRHDLREANDKVKHKNEKIDPSRTQYNEVLFERGGTAKQSCDEIIDKHVTKIPRRDGKGFKPIRKDAVVCLTTSVQFGGDILNLPESVRTEVMLEADKWLDDYYGGEDYKVWSCIHRDESVDHYQSGRVPVTSDGRLSAKDYMTRPKLRDMQQQFLEHIQRCFPALDFQRVDKKDRALANGLLQEEYEQATKALGKVAEVTAKEQANDERENNLNALSGDLIGLANKLEEKDAEIKKRSVAYIQRHTELHKREQGLEQREAKVLAKEQQQTTTASQQAEIQRQLIAQNEALKVEKEKLANERAEFNIAQRLGESLLGKINHAIELFKEFNKEGTLTPKQHRELADIKEHKESAIEKAQELTRRNRGPRR